MNPYTLIIPDIHTEHEWIESAISALAPAKVVFLGDYFDAHGATVSAQKKTAEWLRHSLDQPGRVHLLGNHDIHYAFEGNQCTGYDEAAHQAITGVLGEGWGERLHLYHWDHGRLLTHAGVHPELWPGAPEAFEIAAKEAMDALRYNRWNPLLNCGKDRGGVGRSGLLWLDFHWSFESIPGVPQIVGHTRCLGNASLVGDEWRLVPESVHGSDETENWDLDTKCAWLALLSQDRFEFIWNTWKSPEKGPSLKSLDSAFWNTDE